MQGTRLAGGPQGRSVASPTRQLSLSAPSAPTDDRYIAETFDPGGHLALIDPSYQRRLGQVEIAHAAHTCFETSVPALVEGPCGIGKGRGYLVPVTRRASRGHRMLVVTETNALIQQLMHNDLPLLNRALPWKPSYASLTGRATYLCKKKEAGFSPSILKPQELIAAKALMRWARTTETGKRDEAPAEAHEIWSHVSVGPEECAGESCEVREFCFAELARRTAKQSDIVVTNMHMLALHLQNGRALPDFDGAAIDEAHSLGDVCKGFFGESISKPQAKKFIALCADAEVDAEPCRDLFDRLFESCVVAMAHPLDGLFADSPKSTESGQKTLAIDALPGGSLAVLEVQMKRACGELDKLLEEDGRQRIKYGFSSLDSETVASARTARRMADRFARVLFQTTENQVRWLESGRHGSVEIHIEPVTIGAQMNGLLFRAYPRTFLTSATLTTGGTFGFVRRELGVPKASPAIEIASPFNFEEQAMLIVPPLPDPDNDPEGWADGVQEVLRYVTKTLDGRTLGLFTSTARMKAAAADLERVEGGRRKILVQGQGALRVLIDEKKKDERSVLLGLNSLWTGVDAPGDTVSAVVMDRLPMLVGSPQLDAVKSAMKNEVWTDENGIERKGRDFFTGHYFPKSALRLRQGFGRGVRSTKDVCVTILCDNRILTRPYGAEFLRSLPKTHLSKRLDDLVPFLKYARAVVRGAKE